MRAALALAFWLLSTLSLQAACAGTDLRPSLAPEMRATLAERLEDLPYAEGNHWRASRDGAVIHLIGTLHADDPRFEGVTERLTPLIAEARLMFLEMTETEEAALTERLSRDPSILLLEGTTLPEMLPATDWARLSEALRARGMQPFMAARFKPWYVSMILALPPCMATDLGLATGLDARLQELAKTTGTPTRALEDPMQVFAALETTPEDQQAQMMAAALLPPERAEDIFATLRAAYFDERPGESWVLSELLSSEGAGAGPGGTEAAEAALAETTQALLGDRNRAWLPRILAETREGETLVVAAGAAHLPGPDGLLALLAAEGFTLERRPF
ncbi:TraB/GumN family protein [Roseivivax sp.]